VWCGGLVLVLVLVLGLGLGLAALGGTGWLRRECWELTAALAERGMAMAVLGG